MTQNIPYIASGAAVVTGRPAEVIHKVLSAPRVATVLDQLHDTEVDAARAAIRKAAHAYMQARELRRNSEAAAAAAAEPSYDEAITAVEAAELLGVSIRRAQQLAASGIAIKVHGRWIYDLSAVLALADARRRAA